MPEWKSTPTAPTREHSMISLSRQIADILGTLRHAETLAVELEEDTAAQYLRLAETWIKGASETVLPRADAAYKRLLGHTEGDTQ